jgi:hypothetical protein
MENSQLEEWLADYEAELREGVQKRFGLTDGISDKNRLSDESLQGKDQIPFNASIPSGLSQA